MDKNDGVQKIIRSAGLEKPSVNFTLNVMDKIALEPVFQRNANPFIQKKYYFFGIVPVLVLLYFIPAIMDLVPKITINYKAIDYSSPKDWLLNLFESFNVSISPTIISILLASFLIVAFFAMIQYNENEKTEAV